MSINHSFSIRHETGNEGKKRTEQKGTKWSERRKEEVTRLTAHNGTGIRNGNVEQWIHSCAVQYKEK
jgi:hypothetical protein